ncbi:hypothetical protein [Kitasatospora sp. NPDC050463]|uniref:hypothetical protein n=1 Tax=Kitasatospora sp. NPDC050463 TaxID=3155786 RepID=UPI003405033D
MRTRIRALLVMLLGVFALTVGTVGPALAISPHFQSATTTGVNSNGGLTVTFTEAGLGNNANIDYTASADANATYACLNGGGNHPQAANKQSSTGTVTASGSFKSDKNGSLTGSLVVNPPASTLTCPKGQKFVLASVSYSNVTITDVTHNVSEPVTGGPLTRVFFVV